MVAPPPQQGGKYPTTVDPAIDDALGARMGAVFSAQPIIGGDSKVFAIAAASIVAKVTRDRLMRRYAAQYPLWGFAAHKGYGVAAHFSAIYQHGASPIHRMTFAPLRNLYPLAAAAAKMAVVDVAAATAGEEGVANAKRGRQTAGGKVPGAKQPEKIVVSAAVPRGRGGRRPPAAAPVEPPASAPAANPKRLKRSASRSNSG